MSAKGMVIPRHMTRESFFKRRFDRAKSNADLWMSLHEACQHYTCPARNLYYWTSQYQGAQKNAKIYDTTQVAATNKFVSKLQNALTPPQQVWARLESGTRVDEEFKEELDRALQKQTDIIFDYIRASNFDMAANEAYYDLAVGTGCLVCNEGPDEDPLRWASVPLARLAVENSASGLIDTNFRWWDEIKIEELLVMWPKAKLSPMMWSLYENDPNASIKNLIEGCPENVGIPGHPTPGKKNKYTYFIMHENFLCIDEPLESSPFITFRYSKQNNEDMGRGPVMFALPSIMSLQEAYRLELVSANMNITKPIMAADDGIFNPFTFILAPNTIIPVATSSNGSFPIQVFPDTANPNFMQVTTNDLRMQINTLLYADPLGPIEAPNKTATELALRQRNLAEEIGPAFIRLQKEFLSRVINRVIYILKKKGLIEDIKIDGKDIQVRYQSPLVVAQGQQDVAAFTQWLQLMQGIYGPEAAQVYLEPIKLPFWAANKMGVDLSVLNTEDGIKKMLGEQSEMAQQKEMSLMGEMQNGSTQ